MKTLSTFAFEFPPARHAPRRFSLERSLRFGLVTDPHFADKGPTSGCHYRDSLRKLEDAVARFHSKNAEFILELGDLKDQGAHPAESETISFLDAAEARLLNSGKEVYHVLGNHDLDSISKKDFLAHTHNPGDAAGKGYYAFEKAGLTFIVLDATYREDQSDYDRGNYDWRVALVPDHELAWLEEQLGRSQGPVIVVVHQLLAGHPSIRRDLFVRNAEEVNRLLVASRRVIAVFQGHHHAGDIIWQDDILYFTFPGMVEGPYPENAHAVIEISPDCTLRIELTGKRPLAD